MRWFYIALLVSSCDASFYDVTRTKPRRRRDLEASLGDSPGFPSRVDVESLKRLYPENEKLIASLPTPYYTVIFPVQERHAKSVGISTRDTTANRTGKHFKQTTLVIKAFRYEFRLHLELNANLLAPTLLQKHFLPEGAQQISTQEVENCYYHGTISNYPGAKAAFRTCNGISGVIHVQNETFVIHPFFGVDLPMEHPHIIYQYFGRDKRMYSCGNSYLQEWGSRHSNVYSKKFKRDIRQVTKYIELALVLDQAMFENSTRNLVVSDVLQIINCVDMYMKSINTRISVAYIETWEFEDQMKLSRDLKKTVLDLLVYASRHLLKVTKDATHMLTGRTFVGNVVGMAVPDSICKSNAVGVSQVTNIFEPNVVAVTVTHMLGHNLGISHDHYNECYCPDWWGCIMEQSIMGRDSIQPYQFSNCTKEDYLKTFKLGNGICLLNKPGELETFKSCGNGIVEEEEECDCGNIQDCIQDDPCCDPITCKLKLEAQCSAGPCCINCRLRTAGELCRNEADECDIPEYCNGSSGECPPDLFKKNGIECLQNQGYCFQGKCRTGREQCVFIWGYGAETSELECFQQFNTQGIMNGNCGFDGNGGYLKCASENILCGSLQCQRGAKTPLVSGMDNHYTTTIIYIEGKEYECKVTIGHSEDTPNFGLTQDGTRCGDRKICVNQSCVDLDKYIVPGNCPTNELGKICSGHGICTNVNTCQCDKGWFLSNCSQQELDKKFTKGVFGRYKPTANRTKTVSPSTNATVRTTSYVKKNDSLSASSLVIVMVSVVGGVFIFFALLANCYRKKNGGCKPDIRRHDKAGSHKMPSHLTPTERDQSANRMITFGSLPTYKGDKLQSLDSQQQSGEAIPAIRESSTFIKIPHNDLSKSPEKNDTRLSDSTRETDNHISETFKNMNGYHEDILEALHSAASYHPAVFLSSPNQESAQHLSSTPDTDALQSVLENIKVCDNDREDTVPPCGSLRIRNLEDLLRQYDQTAENVSPAGSEDIRFSEPEADRHYQPNKSDEKKSQRDPSVRFLIGKKGRLSPKDKKRIPVAQVNNGFTTYPDKPEEEVEEEDEDDRGSDENDADDDRSESASPQVARSASEEILTLPNLNSHHQPDKLFKLDVSDYFPSPPSEESNSTSYDENTTYNPMVSRVGRVNVPQTPNFPPRIAPHLSAKKKVKKKFPEYKV
ncbi:disintegrin and metalloproteinase domain-containing protein unc-71-like isoform X1 [Tachypleus tridentatus]|uniref:disintegrin and metalloproteinase domain-containing protein unc-71-like isoform X1 n=1 Tax=Tachypleus tridentatus TaxID=6853 RepID=UPI003FD68319